MTIERTYTSRRSNILKALAEKLKGIDGSGAMLTDVANNVHPFLKFWDEIEEFPAIHLNAGSETRVYQGGGYKDRYLNITIRCYVKESDDTVALDGLIEDVETVLEIHGKLDYTDKQGNAQSTHDILIISIDTDEVIRFRQLEFHQPSWRMLMLLQSIPEFRNVVDLQNRRDSRRDLERTQLFGQCRLD